MTLCAEVYQSPIREWRVAIKLHLVAGFIAASDLMDSVQLHLVAGCIAASNLMDSVVQLHLVAGFNLECNTWSVHSPSTLLFTGSICASFLHHALVSVTIFKSL